jgi:hypothetical protein
VVVVVLILLVVGGGGEGEGGECGNERGGGGVRATLNTFNIFYIFQFVFLLIQLFYFKFSKRLDNTIRGFRYTLKFRRVTEFEIFRSKVKMKGCSEMSVSTEQSIGCHPTRVLVENVLFFFYWTQCNKPGNLQRQIPKISVLFTPLSLRLKCKVYCTDSSLVNVTEDTIGHLELCVNFE